ncbi:MAG TPA: hypothetical protein VL295_07935 [Gemmatimonadales bacterium]|nr:hypothetical protein [Gemmatimonadales bacterium]
MPEIGPSLDQRLAAIDREISGLGTCGWAKARLTPEIRAAAAADPAQLRALSAELDAHAKECTICRIRDEAIERLSQAMPMPWEYRVYSGYQDWVERRPRWLRPALDGAAVMLILTLPRVLVGIVMGMRAGDVGAVLGVSAAAGGGAGLVGGNAYRMLKPFARRGGVLGGLLAGVLLMAILTGATAGVLALIPAFDGGLAQRWVWVAFGILTFTAGPILGWLWFRPSRLS